MPQLPQQRALFVDGLRTRLFVGGPALAGEAVVFVHGSPGSADDFLPLASAVSAFAPNITLDMPGFGEADKPRDFSYGVDAGAEYLGKVIDRFAIRRAHLVLHDFGGAWGLTWAALNMPRLASVTLMNCGLLPGYRWHNIARIYRTPLLGELFMRIMNRRGFRSALTQDSPRGLPADFVDTMYDHFDRDTRHAVLQLYRNTPDPGTRSETMRRTFGAIDRPALVFWGSHDKYLPARFAEAQREILPQAEIHVLEGSGHWPMIDNADAVRERLVPFLRTAVGGATG
ncbi:MAG: alpha/beta fold hydrolase [Pseudomonadota bacterium]